MEAVNATTPLQCLFEDPMGNVAHALVQHLSSALSMGDHMGYSERECWHDCLTSKHQSHSANQTDMQGTEISLRNKQKSEELVKAQGL